MAHNQHMTEQLTTEITVKINSTTDRRAFNERVAAVKEFDATYNAATKIWTIPMSSTRVRVLSDYAEYKGMTSAEIITDALRIGTRYELVGQ